MASLESVLGYFRTN